MDLANASHRLDGAAVTGAGGVATVVVDDGVLLIIKAADPTLNSYTTYHSQGLRLRLCAWTGVD